MRGEKPNPVAAHAGLGESVRGNLLCLDLGDEVERSSMTRTFLGPGSRMEQRAYRVEISVGSPPEGTAAFRVPGQSPRPRGPCPQCPQRLLGRAGRVKSPSRLGEHRREPDGWTSDPIVQRDQVLRCGDRLSDELGRRAYGREGATVLRDGGPLLGSQGPPEAAYLARVGTTQRREQQGSGRVSSECVRLGCAAQCKQQGRDRRLRRQRQLVTGNLKRDTRCPENPPGDGDRPAPRPNENGHLRPGHTVFEVGPAQQVGHTLKLRTQRRIGEDLHSVWVCSHCDRPSGLACCDEVPVVPDASCRQTWERQSSGDLTGGGQEVWASPPGNPQDAHSRRVVVAMAKRLGEVENAAQICATEAIDGLVGIADHDELSSVPGDGLQEPYLGCVGVLILVDEDHREPLPQLGAYGGALCEQNRA